MVLNTAQMFNNVGLIYTPMVFARGSKPIYSSQLLRTQKIVWTCFAHILQEYIQLQNKYPPVIKHG
jgi:hypothetical protein